MVELEDIFTKADFIIPTFSTNAETKKLITDDLINKMNKNSLINVINDPNEIYNHNLLIEKAEKNEISYAFEIYGKEKKAYEYSGNIMATAPYAFYTKEAIDRLIDIWCKNINSIINNEPQNLV